jgi:hypothetical protein
MALLPQRRTSFEVGGSPAINETVPSQMQVWCFPAASSAPLEQAYFAWAGFPKADDYL